MNNPLISGKDMAAGRSRKSSRPRGNWQLMLVNEYGRTVQISHVKRYLVILGGAVTVLFLAALCFAVLFVNERSTHQKLQSSFTQIQDKVTSLMDENDALMARLAILCDSGAAAGTSQPPVREGSIEVGETTPGDETGDAVADQPAAVDLPADLPPGR